MAYRPDMPRMALFDLDDTLTDRRAAFCVWAREFTAAGGLGDSALAFLLRADADHTGPRDAFFVKLGETLGLAEPPGRLWNSYRRRMPELVTCRPADLDALRRLRRAGWRIGIVTNGRTDNQAAKIRNTGLAGLVDGWAISEEAGVRKPDLTVGSVAGAVDALLDPGSSAAVVGGEG